MGDLINGRTPEEIKHVAEWNCYSCGGLECDDCSYLDACTVENRDRAVPDALALIEHLESERDAALAKVPKWISVKERLPRYGERVLVTNDGSVWEAYLSISHKWVRQEFVWAAKVTHWMPLPEPPKEEEK